MNNTKQNLTALNLQTKKPLVNLKDKQSQQTVLLLEYKLMQLYSPQLGIYALPNIQNFRVWNAIIFVRNGFFKDGKFKFDVHFPTEFPNKPPQIYFKGSIFHSYVDPVAGLVDMNALLSQSWNYLKDNMLYNVFASLKRMFVDKEIYQCETSFNPQAAQAFRQKPHFFIQRSLKSVEQSIDMFYQNEPGTSLIIKQYEQGQLAYIRQKVSQLQELELPVQQKSKLLMKFLFEQEISEP